MNIVYQIYFHKFMGSSYMQLMEINYRTYQHKNWRLTSVASRYAAILTLTGIYYPVGSLQNPLLRWSHMLKSFLEQRTSIMTSSATAHCALYTLRQFIKYEMDSIVLKYIYKNLVLPNTEQAIDWVRRPYPILQYSNTYFGRFMDMPPEVFICKTESWEFDCPE